MSRKQNVQNIAEKWECICKKVSIMLMTSSRKEKHLLIQIQPFQSKAVFVLNVPAKFEQDQVKDEEAAPILI